MSYFGHWNPTPNGPEWVAHDVDKEPQVQYSLFQQLVELKILANFSGLYDAEDFLGEIIDKMSAENKMSKQKYD